MSSEHEAAEALALRALSWLAGTDDLLEVFMNATGLRPDGLRARLDDAEFLAAVLDFVMMDDAWIQAAATAAGVRPEDLRRARDRLPGGAAPDWT